MINREEAFVILKKYLKNEDNLRYCIAVEAVMKEMAKALKRDEEAWGLVGLLHNLDYEYTAETPEQRGTLSAQLLDGLLPENFVNAIKANNYMHTDSIPTTSLDKSLIAADSICGLIIVTAKVTPSKKLSEVDLETLIDRFNDRSFATRYNRSRIGLCADVGIDIKVFLDMSLSSLQKISDELKL